MVVILVVVASLEVLSRGGIIAYNHIASESILTREAVVQLHLRGIRALISDTKRREILHPTYGWSHRRGFAEGPDTINRDGLRASREYAIDPVAVTRISAFGNSFVYCNEVANSECWTSRLERGWPVEVLNYGVGGFGTDQAFLRFLAEGDKYDPDIVVIGFAPTNIRRIVNRYRGFLSQDEGPWFKPRFVQHGNGLQLIQAPVRTVVDARLLVQNPDRLRSAGVQDYWYRAPLYEHQLFDWSATYRLTSALWTKIKRRSIDPNRPFTADGVFRPRSEAFKLQLAVTIAFADSARSLGATPVVLILPGSQELRQVEAGTIPSHAPLVDSLSARSILVLDPTPALAEAGARSLLFAPGGHYSAEGNSIVARHVAESLGLPTR